MKRVALVLLTLVVLVSPPLVHAGLPTSFSTEVIVTGETVVIHQVQLISNQPCLAPEASISLANDQREAVFGEWGTAWYGNMYLYGPSQTRLYYHWGNGVVLLKKVGGCWRVTIDGVDHLVTVNPQK